MKDIRSEYFTIQNRIYRKNDVEEWIDSNTRKAVLLSLKPFTDTAIKGGVTGSQEQNHKTSLHPRHPEGLIPRFCRF